MTEKFLVVVTMKHPFIYPDVYFKKPDQNNIMEQFRDSIHNGKLDKHFSINIIELRKDVDAQTLRRTLNYLRRALRNPNITVEEAETIQKHLERLKQYYRLKGDS